MNQTAVVCAVDVGTKSARAGLFTPDGTLVARETAGFDIYEAPGGVAEYASQDIWDAVSRAVRLVRKRADLPEKAIIGLAFDATCSLVLRGADGTGLALGPNGRDTIAWYDHRAIAEAAECTATGHPIIDRIGQTMSPEMQTPKLLWLKRHRPALWDDLTQARDLTDDLAARATGTTACSNCTLTAKWAYSPMHGGWQADFLAAVDLDDLLIKAALPSAPVAVGRCIGGLTTAAAADLALLPGTVVGAGLIDAYAGALGTMGTGDLSDGRTRASLVTGTSSCVQVMSRQPIRGQGIWGPLYGVVLPDHYSCEGGQSAAGALLDHILDFWPMTNEGPTPTHGAVAERLAQMLATEGPTLGSGIHVLPDFNGNRTPFGNASLRGTITGLTLDRSFDALCRLYWRTAVALALGTRQIVDHMTAAGADIDDIAILGGLARSPVMLQLHADVLGMPLRNPLAEDSVLLGTAMAASVAVGWSPDLVTASRAMSSQDQIIRPNPQAHDVYSRDYEAFRLLQRQRHDLNAL